MNTWQTVYEQLQEMLNECVIQWRWYRFIGEYLYCTPTWLRNNDVHSKYYNEIISYHELFSKDSGLMEFVDWKARDWISNERRKNTIVLLQYRNMSSLTSEEKIQYFLDNAIIPIK